MNQSIWQNDIDIPKFSQLENDLQTDVLIIGGGLAGILCAYLLHQQGIDYVLIESDSICRGVSARTTAKITSQHGMIYHKLIREFGIPFARKYWEANESAIEKYRIFSKSIDCDFEEKESILYALSGNKKLLNELEALKQLQIPAEYTENNELPFPTSGIRFQKQAQFHPLKFIAEIVNGLNIFERTRAMQIKCDAVQTDQGKITANKIIVATHFPILNKHGGYFAKLYQDRSYVMALKNAPTYSGMYRDVEKCGFSFRNYRDFLIIGGGSHRTGKKTSGWQELDQLRERYYPNAEVVARWASQDCITLDSVPYIGQYSVQTPNLYVATGFNKWGMTSSMLAAEILSDMVQGKKHEYSTFFSPSRSLLRPQLLFNIMESAINLATPTTPRCPHMGCALKWNKQEHSWDCPCHGSRFTEEGKLLENPATQNIKDS